GSAPPVGRVSGETVDVAIGAVETAAAGLAHVTDDVTGTALADPLRELDPPAPVESGRDHADPKVAVLFKAFHDDAPTPVAADVDGGRRGDRLDRGRRLDVDHVGDRATLRRPDGLLTRVDAGQRAVRGHDVQALVVILHGVGGATAGAELPQTGARLV